MPHEGPLRIAVVGLLSAVKGRSRLPLLLSAARTANVEWHLFGATEGAPLRDVRTSAPRVVVHGAYRRGALAQRLVDAGCSVALLPSVGAEAFSLTLSEITSAGIPTIASNLGALGERVPALSLGWTFDPWNAPEFGRLIERLGRDRSEVAAVAAHVRTVERRTEERMVEDCATVWKEVMGLPRRSSLAENSEAEARYLAGERRARGRKPGALGRTLERLRKTDYYRDLPLRRLVPISARKRLEDVVLRLLALGGRR
jgi:glycosyltransferase involved in cell wall biosynthesis